MPADLGVSPAAEALLARLEAVRGSEARGWLARCPAHDDRDPSLSISVGEGRVLIHCHAGCTPEEIVAAAGLEGGTAALFDKFHHSRNGGGPGEIVAAYDYEDEDGRLLFQVVRYAPKTFRQRRPDGAGGWEWRLGDVRRVLYRLPAIREAIERGDTVYVVEGEKDVHALEQVGAIATCNPGGVNKWRREYGEALRDAKVIVIADRDDAGRQHARGVVRSLAGIAAAVELREPTVGKDVADHLAAGRSKA